MSGFKILQLFHSQKNVSIVNSAKLLQRSHERVSPTVDGYNNLR